MALMDEFREEREKVRNGTWKQKLAYFWEYYKWYVIVPALIIGFVGSTIYQKVTAPDIILNGVLLNVYSMEADSGTQKVIDEFSKEKNIDTKEYEVTLNTSMHYTADDTSGTANYESVQALMAWTAAGTVDFIGGDHASLTKLAYNGYFVDLRKFLNKDELKKYEPYFLYMDAAVSNTLDNSLENDVDSATVKIPDCTDPNSMKEPIPVMIDLSKNAKFGEIYTNSDALAVGLAQNAPNKEMLLEFLDFLIEE